MKINYRNSKQILRTASHIAAELLAAAHQQGHGWGDMAVLCRYHHEIDQCAAALQRRRLPHQVRRTSGSYDPRADTIKVMTMHVSKGLEFPVVALVGVGGMPGPKEDESEEARLFYVAATRATHALYVTLSGQGEFAKRLPNTPRAQGGFGLP